MSAPNPHAEALQAVNNEAHRGAKPCRKCKGRTHHTDSKGKPLCAACIVDAKPKDPKLADWKPGAAAFYKEEGPWN